MGNVDEEARDRVVETAETDSALGSVSSDRFRYDNQIVFTDSNSTIVVPSSLLSSFLLSFLSRFERNSQRSVARRYNSRLNASTVLSRVKPFSPRISRSV